MRRDFLNVIIMVAALGVIGCSTDGRETEPPAPSYPDGPYGLELGDVIPNMTLRAPDGSEVVAESFVNGEAPAVLFYVTASWCFTCGPEINWLNSYQRRLDGELVPMSVLIQNADFEDATGADAEEFGEGYGAEFATLLDPEGEFDDFRDRAFIPRNVLVDASTMRVTLLETGFYQGSLEPAIDAIVNKAENE